MTDPVYSAAFPKGSFQEGSQERIERVVIASVFLDPSVMPYVLGAVVPADFGNVVHRFVWETMIAINADGETVELITLIKRLQLINRLDTVGGIGYINDLIDATSTTAFIVQHCRILARQGRARRTYEAARRAVAKYEAGQIQDEDAYPLEVSRDVELAMTRRADEHLITIGDGMIQATDTLIEEITGSADATSTETGYTDLDNLLDGMRGGQVIVLGGRPAMGKTALALNIATNVVEHYRDAVMFVSLEMDGAELARRQITQEAGRTFRQMRHDWSTTNVAAVQASIDRWKNRPLYVSKNMNATTHDLRLWAGQIKRKQRLRLVVLDYIQLMRSDGEGESNNREQELSRISRQLKLIAKELDVPVLVLSQLNRGVEGRSDRRPMISDLRESGAIEQDADVVLFVYRHEVYSKAEVDHGKAEVIVAKQRNGATDTVHLHFVKERTRFENVTESQRSSPVQVPSYIARIRGPGRDAGPTASDD